MLFFEDLPKSASMKMGWAPTARPMASRSRKCQLFLSTLFGGTKGLRSSVSRTTPTISTSLSAYGRVGYVLAITVIAISDTGSF